MMIILRSLLLLAFYAFSLGLTIGIQVVKSAIRSKDNLETSESIDAKIELYQGAISLVTAVVVLLQAATSEGIRDTFFRISIHILAVMGLIVSIIIFVNDVKDYKNTNRRTNPSS